MFMYGPAMIPLIKLLSVEDVTQKWYAGDKNAVGKLSFKLQFQPSSIKIYHWVNFSATTWKHPHANSLSRMKNSVKLKKSSQIQEPI